MSTSYARESMDQEELVVRMLERLKPNTLTMQGLEKAYEECQHSRIAMVVLADFLFRIIKVDLQEFSGEVADLIEQVMMKREEGGEEKSAMEIGIYEDIYICSIVDWIYCCNKHSYQ
ncbi:hypothetical protein GOP47_0016111 [Adiantum capillus-veneris]|uniref:Uncharacterized protein n=1 Tax=Adiantum capillus-veneris TaxID=13818 RepID=A0A9D4UKY3_ADICA|nr:hypothetical protein GOP47_0016111 [Adiantum capillus-veneris]